MFMKFKAVELKHLDEKTICQIRIWRNQPFVRSVSLNQNEISEEEHEEFIKNVLADENRGLFVFYLDERPIGVYQYIRDKQSNVIKGGNYLIEQDYINLGYGTIMAYFIMEIGSLLKVSGGIAEVLSMNKHIISLNKKFGGRLVEIQEKHVLVGGRYEDVYVFQYKQEDWNKYRKKIGSIVYSFVEKKPIENMVQL